MTFNVLLVLHHLHVLVHLLKRSQDDGFALFIELWTASSTEDLLHIEHAHVFVCAGRRVIYFGALDQNGVSRQIDTPSEGRCRAEHFDVAIVEHGLHHVSVLAEHTSVMYAEAVRE